MHFKKDNIREMKRQFTMGNIYKNISDGLEFSIPKDVFLKLNKMMNNPIKKWTQDLSRYFSKEDILLDTKIMK